MKLVRFLQVCLLLSLTTLIALLLPTSSPAQEGDSERHQRLPHETEDSLFGPAYLGHEKYSEASAYLEYLDPHGLTMLREIAEESSGQEMEAIARIALAANLEKLYIYRRGLETGQSLRDIVLDDETRADIRQQYQRVIDAFPQTQYWVEAKIELIKLDVSDPQQIEEEVNRIASDITGVSHQSVLAGERPRVSPELRALYPMRFWNELSMIYMNSAPANLYMAEFVRSTFPSTKRTYPLSFILDSVPTWEETPPNVEIVFPSEGQLLSPTEVRLQVRANGGSIREIPIELGETIVQLDGVDIFDRTSIDSRLSLEDTVFERLTFDYAPDAPLAPGSHTFYVRVERNPQLATERTVTFLVQSQPSTPLSLTLDVLSKHVKPQKGELARVRATASHSPATCTYSITRQGGGQLAYTSSTLAAPDGTLVINWDGLDNQGQRVSNGSYLVQVDMQDSFGARAQATAQVVVNFQGGH